jgi:S-adenosylmethionine:tRNA ribosyltransferase-isomerase
MTATPIRPPLDSHAVDRRDVQLVVIDRGRDGDDAVAITGFAALPELLAAGDLVVVNDAATLPASFAGVTDAGLPVEVRLIPPVAGPRVAAVLFGAGDHRTPTEHRPPPPPLGPGDLIALGAGLRAHVVAVAGRQATLDLAPPPFDGDATAALWQAIYRAGGPVQYAHRALPLPLWAVQTTYASRPWSAEMPSAGRPLTWDTLLALRRRGIGVAALTHAAGLSATGDPVLDAALPLPEPYDLPAATVDAIAATRAGGGRVIAIGTTVVRALEAAALAPGGLAPGPGLAALVITPSHRLRVVDGIVSGLHGPEESHFRLLGAMVPRATLDRALDRAAAAGLNGHELGDACLIAGDVLPAAP